MKIPSPTEEPTPQIVESTANTIDVPPTPLRCFTGALISGVLATALYFLTTAIAQSFAAKPISSGNITAINISVAVRTLVVGMSTLATAIFGITALGLIALGMQLLIKRFKGTTA
jgi:hypothetical protein